MGTIGRQIPQVALLIRSGDVWQTVLNVNDGGDHDRDGIIEDPNNPTALDVSGYNFLAQIRASKKSATVMATITVDKTNAVAGRLVLSLNPTQTTALNDPSGGKDIVSAVWDFQATPTSDSTKPLTWFEGPVSIELDVSRIP